MTIVLVHRSKASRREHLQRARGYADRHGRRLVLVTDRRTAWEDRLADDLVVAETADLAGTVDAAVRLVRTDRVSAVTTLVEHAVPAAAAVAARLRARFVRPETARLARDKYAMREAFARAGLRQPRYGLAADPRAAGETAARLGYPVVLKPVLGGGSKFVRRVDGPDELAAAFPAIRTGSWAGFTHDPLHDECRDRYGEAVLIEEFVPGREISVESLVDGGRTTVVAVHDKPQPLDGPYFAELHYATPSDLAAGPLAAVHADTDRAHRALGLDVGATHTEFRIGDDGRPVVVETAARLGGGPVYQSVRLSTGVDLVDAVLDLATGLDPRVQVPASPRPVGFWLFFAARAGRIRDLSGLQEVAALPWVDAVEPYHRVGDVVDVPPQAAAAHGHVLFHAGDRAELERRRAELGRLVRIETVRP